MYTINHTVYINHITNGRTFLHLNHESNLKRVYYRIHCFEFVSWF